MDLIKTQSILSKLDVVDMAYLILDDMSEFIADLNRKRLIDSGKDSNDDNIGDYKEYTTVLKETFGKGAGSIIDHVTGYDTGESHKKIFSSVIGDELIVDTPTVQWLLFEDHFNNKEILGLTNKEQALVKKEFETRFTKAINGLF